MSTLCTGKVTLRHVEVPYVSCQDMARPKVEDETLEKAAEIIDGSVSVPLPSHELSANQQLRIIVDAVYAEFQDLEPDQALIIDRNDTSREEDIPEILKD